MSRFSDHLTVRVAAIVIAAYTLFLWTAQRRVGEMPIFAGNRTEQVAEFHAMVSRVSADLDRFCKTGHRTAYFTDDDAVTPYLPIENGKVGKCRLIRPTDVTPADSSQFGRCGSLLFSARGVDGARTVTRWRTSAPGSMRSARI